MRLFKQTALALLLLALSVTSFAAPPGWVEGVASKDVNAAVAADASAIHRGGALIVDHSTLQQQLLPWNDGDSITLDFILPGALSGCAATPVGWECDIDGTAWRAGVADLDGVKGAGNLSTALDGFTAPGAQSYVRIPVGEIPTTGEWRPIDKQLGGDWGDFNFVLQPELTAQEISDGAERPPWAVNSIAVYHKTKRNDNTAGYKYMTGKAAHLPAPVAVGFRSNQTTVTGWTYGAWEIDTGTGVLTKVFDAAVIDGWNNTDSVVVDATLGYTTMGASQRAVSANTIYGAGDFTATEDGTLESLTFGLRFNLVTAGRNFDGAIYNGLQANAVGGGGVPLVSSTYGLADSAVLGGAGYFCTRAISGSITNGSNYFYGWTPVSTADDIQYDNAVGGDWGVYAIGGHTQGSAWPDPNNVSSGINANQRLTAYVTYSAAAPPGGGDSGPLNLGLGLGL